MFIIGEAIVSSDVLDSKFTCDLEKCKGACCTMEGGRGAPLLDEEVGIIQDAAPEARKYLDQKHIAHIDAHGFIEGKPGDYTTKCIDDKACVFVYYTNGIARCSLERAFEDGKTTWKKPISCHLFPIRISSNKPVTVTYERISECSAGVQNGTRNDISLVEFLQEPLQRRFGSQWYLNLISQFQGVDE